MPGILASRTLWGNGESQRSGFHSSASGPHTAGLRLAERMERKKPVWAGTGIVVVVDPSRVAIGTDVVNTASFRDLMKEDAVSILDFQHNGVYSRSYDESDRWVSTHILSVMQPRDAERMY